MGNSTKTTIVVLLLSAHANRWYFCPKPDQFSTNSLSLLSVQQTEYDLKRPTIAWASLHVVGRPTRWSLLFIFGFLFWSSSWCLRPHIGVSFSVWPLLRAGMVVLDQFFSKMYFLYIWRSQNKNFTKFCEVLPPQKKVYFRTLGVSQKLWLNRPHFGIKYR